MPATIAKRRASLTRRFPNWAALTLDQRLDRAAEEFGTRDYVVTDTRTYSYLDIKAWSERIAGGLVWPVAYYSSMSRRLARHVS